MNERQLSTQKKINNWLQQTFKPNGASSSFEESALASLKGNVRDENQDRAAIVRISPHTTLSKAIQVAVLCDGIGGMPNGADAATLALSSFISHLATITNTNRKGFLNSAAIFANDEVYTKYQGESGCTLSAVSFDADGIIDIANYGDSRVYLYSKNILKQLTVDGTLDGQLAKLNISEKPSLPEFKHLIQFIGMKDCGENPVIEVPTISRGDKLLVVSDGAYNVGIEVMEKALVNAPKVIDGVQRLLRISEWLGSKDNATAICVPAFLQLDESEKNSSSCLDVWTWHGNLTLMGTESSIYKVDKADYKITGEKKIPPKTEKIPQQIAKKKTQKTRKNIETSLLSSRTNPGKFEKESTQLKIEFKEEEDSYGNS